jgi:acyl-CoA synthetase (NDP forming)
VSRTEGPSAEAVRNLFEPRSVAIVGASMSGRGLVVVESLRDVGFTGEVACVNPKYQEIAGYPCYPSLAEIPFVPDAVVVAVARDRVVSVVEQCAAIGAKSAVVLAIGFAEANEEGKQLQEQIVRIANDAGMAILGPNCQGLINFAKPVSLYMDNVYAYKPGRVGFLAQSGSVMTALTNNRRGVRWSHAVSSGNEAVVDAAAVLEFYVSSSDVDVICMFLESIRRPGKFFEQCDLARELGKPIVIMKTGKTPAAQRAAAAHSGALAVPERLIDARFKRHGVLRADSLEELLETTIAMQSKKRPVRGQIAALTASGGQIELVLDNLPGTGLSTPAFTASTQEALGKLLPDFLPPKNPLDWWGMDDYDTTLPTLVAAVAADEGVDIIVQVSDFTFGPTGESNRAGGSVNSSTLLNPTTKELFVVLDGVGGAPSAEEVEESLEKGVLVLSGFDTGLRALGHLVEYGAEVAKAAAASSVDTDGTREILARSEGGLISGGSAFHLLEAAGLMTAKGAVSDSESSALVLADQYGYPVVAKIADEGVSHKSDGGGVILNIANPDELSAAIVRLQNLGAKKFLIQEQVTGGVEIFLGLQTEPTLGTFVIAGLGGIWAEMLNDVQIRPVGLREGEALQMLQQLRGYATLTGARGSELVDLDALVGAIEQLDALGQAIGSEIVSLDVNPLVLAGSRAIAVDALLVKPE